VEGVAGGGNGDAVVFAGGEGDEVFSSGGVRSEYGEGFGSDIINYGDGGFKGGLGLAVVDDAGDEREVRAEDRCAGGLGRDVEFFFFGFGGLGGDLEGREIYEVDILSAVAILAFAGIIAMQAAGGEDEVDVIAGRIDGVAEVDGGARVLSGLSSVRKMSKPPMLWGPLEE
jgi:hypothetical protein